MHIVLKSLSVFLVATCALAACGGGSDSPAPAPNEPPVQGIDRTGIRVFATINGFSSVIVGGRVFSTGSASIEFDELAVSETALQVGHVAFVVGEIDDDGNAGATSIVADDVLRGPIEAIDSAAETLTVLGQVVRVDVSTVFDDSLGNNGLAGLSVGQSVAISGFVLPDGMIAATRIESDDGDDLQLYGVVANADSATMRFEIGALTVDYSGAALDDFDGAVPTDGDFVEVEGDRIDGNGVLVATEVELQSGNIGGAEGDDFEIEGVVSAVNSPTEFVVNGITINTDATTLYVNGTAADLVVGAEVDIDASLQANGTPLAEEIEFENDGEVRIEANVEAVDANAGTLTVLGITVDVPANARLEDDSDQNVREFTIDDINVGDFVEIGAELTGPMRVRAKLIERDDDDNDGEVELRARVDSVAQPELVVLGVQVRTDANTEFENDDDQRIDPSQFFAVDLVGRLVDVDGFWDGSVLLAEDVELEDE